MRGALIASLGLVISLAGYQAYALMMGPDDGTYYAAQESFDPTYMPTVLIIGLGIFITCIGVAYYFKDKDAKAVKAPEAK